MRSLFRSLLASLTAFLVGGALLAGPAASADVSGLAYFDYFYNIDGSTIAPDSSAFTFRRIYLTADSKLNDTFSARFRLEADGAQLTSKGKLGVFVKDASLKWNGFVEHGALVAGLTATPLWTHSEKVWGYRSIEKTLLDYRDIGTSADVGVALLGTFGEKGPFGYSVLLANGAGQKPEDSRTKKLYVAFPITSGPWVLEPVADFESVAGDRDRRTLKLFVGHTREKGSVGLEGFYRTNSNAGPMGDDAIPIGISGFGRYTVAEGVQVFGRFDYFDPDSERDSGQYTETLILLGVDYAKTKEVHIVPNASIVSFSGKDDGMPDRDANIVARITLVYSYK